MRGFTPSSSPLGSSTARRPQVATRRITEVQYCVNVYPNTLHVSRIHQHVVQLLQTGESSAKLNYWHALRALLMLAHGFRATNLLTTPWAFCSH